MVNNNYVVLFNFLNFDVFHISGKFNGPQCVFHHLAIETDASHNHYKGIASKGVFKKVGKFRFSDSRKSIQIPRKIWDYISQYW